MRMAPRRVHAQGRHDLSRRLFGRAAAGRDDVCGVVVVFRDTSAEQADEDRVRRELDTLAWVGRIRDALDEDRLVLYSQPIVPLAGGQPSQELLLRMIGPGGEIIPPGSFLPVAEKYGLIGEIDRWVIGKRSAWPPAVSAWKRTSRRSRSATSTCFP